MIASLKSGLLGLGGFSWGLWERAIVKYPPILLRKCVLLKK
ncbi:hypothetical protein HMPREF1415_01139 [Helicobacter pylori GAM254Ai]|nr:hypothetical protein HMPREF1415_01139 [Helicobacter pylori GAM254Ai]